MFKCSRFPILPHKFTLAACDPLTSSIALQIKEGFVNLDWVSNSEFAGFKENVEYLRDEERTVQVLATLRDDTGDVYVNDDSRRSAILDKLAMTYEYGEVGGESRVFQLTV